jgi:hypothetical protein
VWGIASTVLARVLVRHRPPAEARRSLPPLLERWRRTATWPQLWTTLRLVAEHLAATDDPHTALVVFEASELDAAAPRLSEADARVHRALRARIRAEVGPATVSGIATGAATIDRSAVVERAQAALRRPLDRS